MKFKNKLFTTAAIAAILIASGCSKDKFNINSNPDSVTDVSVTPSVLLPGAQQETSRIIAADWPWLQMWMGFWARSGSYQSITEVETYKFTNDFQVAVWNDLYSNANNYNIMQQKAAASGQGFYDAVGRIMRSHNFQMLTDVYNDIPYSDALKGTVVSTPRYDKAIDVYKGIFGQLDTAITLLKSTTSSSSANPDKATADLVYAGDNASWIRFANTLRLRMIIHLHNGISSNTVVSGISISEQMGKITSEGYIGAGQSAHLNPGFSASKPQPYYRYYNTNESGTGTQRDQYRASDYAIEYYKYNGDPRIDRFYVSPNGTTAGQKGIVFGTPSGNGALTGAALSTVRGPGLSPNGANSRAWILTSVESLFLQAEARQRGLITSGPTAAGILNNAVTESFVWLGLTSTQASSYITANAGYPDVDITAAGGGLFTILSQKWFALNTIAPYEVWTDYRRTDYVLGAAVGYSPGPPLSVDPGRTATSIPKRLFYPQNEYNYNATNVNTEGTINVFTGKIFWDLN